MLIKKSGVEKLATIRKSNFRFSSLVFYNIETLSIILAYQKEVFTMRKSDELDTSEVLDLAEEFARDRDIDDVVVASTSGDTGLVAIKTFDPIEKNLVVVGHSTGFSDQNEQELNEEAIGKIERAGGKVFVGPMVFHNINSAIGDKEGFSSSDLVADTLRLFGQGTKVALECVLMAADAGLVDAGKDVLSIAGTGSGVDTVLLIHSANSKDFFESRVKEVVAKPAKKENLKFWG